MFELILRRLGELFLAKVVEHAVDNTHENMKNMKDFDLNLKNLHEKLKLLNAKASDIEDEIKNATLSGRKKRKRKVTEWLEEVESVAKEVDELGSLVESEGFIVRLMDGDKAAKLSDHVDSLVEQSRSFGELLLDVSGYGGETLLTNGMVGRAFHENLEIVLKVLASREVLRVGVYGMGGVGKTTLAKHIHNKLLKRCQGRVLWVTVSQEFTIKSLQGKIARLVGVHLMDEDEEDVRAARLHRALSKQKDSVLILDDVWENIDLLKIGCPLSMECCRLIITTRSLEVCRQFLCQRVIAVEKLRENEAWKLFSETLGNETKLGPRMEEIAKSMARLCDGLPLGIITVAGSMRGATAIHTWVNALTELKKCVVGEDDVGDDEVFKVLKYSFDRLNRNQKSNEFNTIQLCFLYCSLYPEDYEIGREDLVGKLISEGLVDQGRSRRSQIHQGHVILDKLLNVCLMESCFNYNGTNSYECVKMHDLVRGMVLNIGQGKYMVRAGDKSTTEIPSEYEWTKDPEKVSLMYNGIRGIGEGISPNCPNLSTLLLGWNPLEVIPNSFFSRMQRLCTLDLCGSDVVMLPDSITEMRSLEALHLQYCYKLKNLPNLGKLKALRELNLSYTAIIEAPQGLEELVDLKFFSMYVEKVEMLPRGYLLKLGDLQHINIPFHIQVTIEDIEKMKHLEEFSGGVKNVSDFNHFVRSRVHDSFYAIGVGLHDSTPYRLGVGFFYPTPYRVGGGLGCFDNELILFECNLKDEKVLGHGIVYLTIKKCEGLSISFLDDFPRLKKMRIESCGGIDWILRSNEQGLPSSSLEVLELVELEDFKGLIPKGATQSPFSSLRRLRIENCNKMGKLGLRVLGVQNLEFMEIGLCGEIEEIFEDEGRGPVALPGLKELRLNGLPRLNNVCKAMMICNSIKGIYIRKCPRLVKKLPLHMDDPPPSTLREIEVEKEWWESLEWDNTSLPHLLKPFCQIF